MRKSVLLVASFSTMAMLLTGCQSSLTGDSYSRDEARRVQTIRMGTIESLRPVKIEGTKTPIGTARLLPDGHIGRVSVLKDWRGMKVGDALMQAVIAEAEARGLKQQMLSAQVQATAFYERLGFSLVSEEFLEAGIPHVDMVRHSA